MAQALNKNSLGVFRLKLLDIKDLQELRVMYAIRTHPCVASELFGLPPDSFESHVKWVTSTVARDREIFICYDNNVPVGYAQVYNRDCLSNSVEVGWALHPKFHGKGFGIKAVEATLDAVFANHPFIQTVRLEVKSSNLKAIHIYSKAGFKIKSSDNNVVTMERVNYPTHKDAAITYLGHAGFMLERGAVRLVCDPWFYGAFYNSWYPSPDNRNLISTAYSATHLYISHGHEDHYDKKFLDALDPDINIIAPNFKNKQMQKLLYRFRNVTFLDHLHKTQIADIELTMFIDTVSPKNDSALLIDFGYKILDQNDCYIPFELLPKVDMLWSQFSGAFHYPHCYDFSDEVKARKVKEVKEKYFDDLLRRVENTRCAIYLPSAGPPCFLDPSQEHLNSPDTIFYPWNAFKDNFNKASSALAIETLPGTILALKDKNWSVLDLYKYKDTMSLNRLEETVLETPDYFCHQVEMRDLQRYFSKLRADHLHLLKIQSKAFNLNIPGSGSYVIVLSPAPITVYKKDEAPKSITVNYSFTIPALIMEDILTGGKWDAAFLSNRISLHRDVDVYDSVLFQLLYADNDPERTKEMAEMLGGQVEMTTQGGFCYQRYCPHAGTDLSTAEIKNGIIECPRHNWKWDLKSGACVSGGNSSLKVKPDA